MFDVCVILAGGAGTRLWPASTAGRPKQFLPVSPGKSFLACAVERGLAVTGAAGRVAVIAGRRHLDAAAAACAGFAQTERERLTLIGEPAARNTAPAIACGLAFAETVCGGGTILVLTSDHIIRPLDAFAADAETAAAFAAREQLVVFGIRPHAPETGYGYIEAGEALAAPGGDGAAFRAARFREKPDRETAERFLAAGNFYWNSGMFAFSAGFMRREFRALAQAVSAPFEALEAPPGSAFRDRGGVRALDWPGLDAAYEKAPSISFDYAVAEKCRDTVMVRPRFEWADVGSWDEYARLAGASGGASEVYAAGAANCFVDADVPVALCGVEDLVVVARSGRDGGAPAVLVMKKGASQGLRDIVGQIRDAGRKELL
ncbi:MAG: mannose-1-phosphate guanylyltransferase [GDP] (GDP-mannose pyrophosphorylase) (GMP) [Treponematales bacterium]